MSRTRKFAINAATAAIDQIVAMLVGFITPRIMITVYGSEINGLISSLNQFISYLSLVEAGLSGAAIYSLYKPLANGDVQGVSRIVEAARRYYIRAGYFFTGGMVMLALAYAITKKTGTVSAESIFFLTILLGANNCADFFLLARYRSLLTADQRSYVIMLVTIVQMVLRTGIICALSMPQLDVILLQAIALFPLLIKIAALQVYSKKRYAYLNPNVQPDYSALDKRWDVIYQQILGVVQTGAPVIIISFLQDFITLSVFSIYNMVVNGINGVLSIFIAGLPAGFGELIAKKEYFTLKKTTAEFEVAYYYVLSIVYGVTMVMMMPFINIYTRSFADANYSSPLLAFFIVLNGLLYNIKTPQSMLIISAGLYKETRYQVTVQGLLIIVFGTIGCMLYGLWGVMIGACISNLYRTIDLLFTVPKWITQNSVWDSARRMLCVVFNLLLIALPPVWMRINPGNYAEWIAAALLVGLYAVFVVTGTTLIFERHVFYELVNRLIGINSNRRKVSV